MSLFTTKEARKARRIAERAKATGPKIRRYVSIEEFRERANAARAAAKESKMKARMRREKVASSPVGKPGHPGREA